MRDAIDMALFILNKHYRHSRAIPAYVAATLLDPTRRKRHLEHVWDGSEMNQAINDVQAIWEVKYKNLPSSIESQQKKKIDELSVFERIREELSVALDPEIEDDFSSFIDAPPIRLSGLKPIEWWCLIEQRARYPRLHQMAIDILSILPMSDAPEWTFSSGRSIVSSWSETQLEPGTIEMLELVSDWVSQDSYNGGVKEPFDEFCSPEDSAESSDAESTC
jgi:hAT family protein